MTFSRTPRPTYSRWGAIQSAKEWKPGIWQVTTAGHGGIIVSPERLAAMPEWMRATPYSGDGQFEEDADWCLPVMAFAKEFEGFYAFEGARKPLLEYARESYNGSVKSGYFKPNGVQPDGFDVNLTSRFD